VDFPRAHDVGVEEAERETRHLGSRRTPVETWCVWLLCYGKEKKKKISKEKRKERQNRKKC
jgi:hypothetical protein